MLKEHPHEPVRPLLGLVPNLVEQARRNLPGGELPLLLRGEVGHALVQPVPVHIPHGEIDIALQVVGQGAEHLDLDPLVPARCPLDGPDIGGEDAQPIQKTSHTVGTAAVTTVLIGARGAVSHQQANGSVYTEPLLATTASVQKQRLNVASIGAILCS